MTALLAAGDWFVRSEAIAAALRPAAEAHGRTLRELRLPWPVEPYGPVAEVDEASGDEDELIAALEDVEVCVSQMAPFTARVLAAAPALRLICITRGGPVNVNLAAASERGVTVAAAPGRNAVATAEHTVALILAAARRIPARHEEILRGEWRSDYYRYDRVGPEIAGSTVGLVGYGAVGSRVAAIMAGFGAHVLVHDPYADPDTLPAGVERVETLDVLLGRSSIVTIHARLTPETRHLIGEREIARMPEGSILVNAARGGLLDYAAFDAALRSGHLYAGALDVYDEEPLPAGSPLRTTPHLVMTPHLAGATRETADRAVAIAARQVAQYLAGEQVDFVVR